MNIPLSLRLVRGGLAACALVGLAACQTLNAPPPVDVAQPTIGVRPQPLVVPAVNNGAIFQAAAYRPLFEDHRARLVGDTLTVQIVEKVSATQKSTSSVDKSGKLEAGITALPFLSANSFGRASASGSSSSTTSSWSRDPSSTG